MKGETRFLTTRLWRELGEDRYWQVWQAFVDAAPESSNHPAPPDDAVEMHLEQQRLGRLIARIVAEALEVDTSSPCWGFKEIWNGIRAFDYSWDAHNAVFPNAVWVHLVRHPLDFAASCAAWNQEEVTVKYIKHRMLDWVRIVRRSREQQSAGQFIELRYEDLIESPPHALRPVLDAVALEWDEKCDAPRGKSVLASQTDGQSNSTQVRDLANMVQRPDGFDELVREFGYSL